MSYSAFNKLTQVIQDTTQYIEKMDEKNIENMTHDSKKKMLFSVLDSYSGQHAIYNSIFSVGVTSSVIAKTLSFLIHDFSDNEISLYLDKLSNIFEVEVKHFKDKVKLLLPILNCSNLKTCHLNKMVEYLIATPQNVIDEKYDSAQSIDKYAHLFFDHPLFSSKENAKNVAKLYYQLIDNLIEPSRNHQFCCISRNRAFPLKNSNFQMYLKNYPEQTKHVIKHMNMDQNLFNSYLNHNIEYIENSYFNYFNSLTYLIVKAEDKFPFNILISHYLEHSKKLISDKDHNKRYPIEYAKKGILNYTNKPSYKILVESGAKPIESAFLNSIQFFSQIFQKKERKDNFVYQDEIKEDALNLNKKRVQKNISETIYQIQALNLIQSSEIISIIEQIGKIASETLDKHNSNFNENYLFIQEAVLNYLPTFTNDFVKGYKITKNTAFLVEYSTQIGLLYEKMIEKFNLLNDITDDALLEKMKQNTKFLQAKN